MLKLLTIIPLLLLTACVSPSGTLEVKERLTLIHTTMFGNHKTVHIAPGKYQMSLQIKSNNRLKLRIDGYDPIKLKLNQSVHIPNNGHILLTADQLGQHYDMDLTINTKKYDSEIRRRHQRCSYQVPRMVCDPRDRCRTVYETRYGYRTEDYFVRTTIRKINMELLKSASNIVDATFNGVSKWSQDIVTWHTTCR